MCSVSCHGKTPLSLKTTSLNYFLTGLIFSILWASASIAGKFGLRSVDGLTLFSIRFLSAGLILIVYARLVKKDKFPAGREWIHISIFGLFNITLYLGLFIVALKSVAAGITALAVALNPLLISIMTALWLKRKVTTTEWLSIALGIAGVAVATFPLLQNSHASVPGLVLLGFSMVAYSAGSVYYAATTWALSRTTINGWQGLIGGLLLLPFAVLTYDHHNQFDTNFWISTFWLVLMVSIFAVQLWLRLLHYDTVRASLWLFLCPIFGLALATGLLNEPFTIHTALGAGLVLAALYIGQKKNQP